MFFRFLTVLLSAAVLLAGCVLQSEAPLFADRDGVAALAPLGSTFVTWNQVDGAWQAEKDRVVFTAVGNHYEVPGDDGEVVSVTFVALENDTWVMQAAEPDKPAAYLIARRDGKALLLQVPECLDLKNHQAYARRLRFDRDDCFAPADFKREEFTALAGVLPPAKVKLEAVE